MLIVSLTGGPTTLDSAANMCEKSKVSVHSSQTTILGYYGPLSVIHPADYHTHYNDVENKESAANLTSSQ